MGHHQLFKHEEELLLTDILDHVQVDVEPNDDWPDQIFLDNGQLKIEQLIVIDQVQVCPILKGV